MQRTIVLEPVSKQSAYDLAIILNRDKTLRQSLGIKHKKGTTGPKETYEDITKWQTENNASSYVIKLKNKSIGLISLSHQKGVKARIGYWLASSEWNKGYATQAIKQIISIAKKQGLTELTATIESSNTASKRIWENLGATFDSYDDMLTAALYVK